jgi:hypothetical protein
MRVRVSYTVTVSDRFRRQISAYFGRGGLATRAEVAAFYRMFGFTMDDDVSGLEPEGE